MTVIGPILIVNADDFGRSRGVNREIVGSHESGIVTWLSLLERVEAAAEAAEYARANRRLSGCRRSELGEWGYREREWRLRLRYQVVPPDDEAAVREEIDGQLDAFRRLAGRDLSHLDSHQHVHGEEPIPSIVAECQLQVPVRHLSRRFRYCGQFDRQTKKRESACETIVPDGVQLRTFHMCKRERSDVRSS